MGYRIFLYSFLVGCIAHAGCGAGLSGRSRQHLSEERISVELRALDGNVRVVVPGRLGEEPVEWMLDTGASWHAVDAADARERGLLEPVPSGLVVWVDVTVPVSVSVFRAGTPVGPLRVGTDREDVVGVVSPQRLAGDGAVELDLARGKLSRWGPEAARATSDEVALRGARLELCSDDAGRSVPVVGASVEGQAVRLLVDTGSPISMLFTDTEAGALTSLRTSAHYEIDDPVFDSGLAIVPAVLVSVAGVATSERMGIIDRPSVLPSSCEIDGLLGLDVLRGCTLILSDVARDGNAIACEPATALDTSPTLTRMTPVARPTPLAARAAALPPGVAAMMGCASLTEAELSSQLPSSPTVDEREAYLRRRSFEHFAAEIHAEVREAHVDRAVEEVRTRLGPDAFEAGLAAQNMTLDAYRAAMRIELIERQVEAWIGLDRGVLATRLRDRYARVAIVRTATTCFESWPVYFLEDIVFVGLTPADERAARLGLARALRGGAVTLGAAGVLPALLTAAVEQVFAPRGLVPQFAIIAEGPTLEVEVTLDSPSPN